MGGHGGLNILPQKRWNVYRDDCRAKVARDEALHQKTLDEASYNNRVEKFNSKLSNLKKRWEGGGSDGGAEQNKLQKYDEQESDGSGDEINNINNNNRRSSQNAEIKKSNSNKIQNAHHSPKPIPHVTSSAGHINLFEAEELAMRRERDKHRNEMEAVGHEEKAVSDFKRLNFQSSSLWYMQKGGNDRLLPVVGEEKRARECFAPPSSGKLISNVKITKDKKIKKHKSNKEGKNREGSGVDKLNKLREERLERERRERLRIGGMS